MSLFCTACGCSYGSPREEGEVCGDLSCWSRIACAGILRDVPFDDDVRRLQETSYARDVEGELLAAVLGGKIGLDEKGLGEIRIMIAEQAKDIAKDRKDIAAKRAKALAEAEGR